MVCRVPALLLAAACCLGAAPAMAQSAGAAPESLDTLRSVSSLSSFRAR